VVSGLLLCGLLASLLAGLLAAGFSFLAGEPSIERAIAFETAREPAAAQPSMPEIVSRSVQRGAGLLTAYIVYGAAIGGLFSLVFALAYGRVKGFDPKALSALLAFAGFVTMVLVPELKYPANPPAIGAGDDRRAHRALFCHARDIPPRHDPRRDARAGIFGKARLLERRACCGHRLCRGGGLGCPGAAAGR
jgi:hypothetical protein